MSEGFDLNNQSKAAGALPPIPTSASEVAVRTLASDLEAMGQSGGMLNQGGPASMQVPVALHFDSPAAEEAAAQHSRSKVILITAAIILAILGLFALGYFVL